MSESDSILNRIGYISCRSDHEIGMMSVLIFPQSEERSCHSLHTADVLVFRRKNRQHDNGTIILLPF